MQKPKKAIYHHFGIDIESNLHWQSWELGGEYSEIITLKNVDLRTKKVKYRIVNGKYFASKYPQSMVLNVGSKVNIPVVFRPLEKDMYEDSIEFITKDGSFHIPITAVPAEIQLSTPETINFGMCAVQDSVTISFEIANICDFYVFFQLQSDLPFVLQPVSGNLAPRTQCKINATFQPEGAFVYETTVTCNYGNNSSKTNTKIITLEGIGKFPYLSLKYENITGSEITVDFGEVVLGETLHKIVEIKNCTPVNVPFQIIQKSLGLLVDNAFQCSQYHGVIPAEYTHKIRVSFKPENFNLVYADNFEVLPVALINKLYIKCIGQGKSLNVSANVKSVNFGVTAIGVEVVRSFKLINGSCSPALYQIKTDPQYSKFLLNETCGKIEANSSKKIIVKFIPTQAIPYYKKLFCLILNQEPLTVELFGTCVSKDIKPAVLTQKHIDNNSIYMLRGISRLAPEGLSMLIEEKKIVFDENGLLQVNDIEVDNNLTKNKSVSSFDEFFNDGSSDSTCTVVPHISLDTSSVHFGVCKENLLFHKSVCVRNHTQGKVVCVWMNDERNHFFVSPAENEIAPMSSLSFKITFKPDVQNKMFSAELEAFVFYKSMRDQSLVNDCTITVPWCLTVVITGHTFGRNSEFYLPVCSWSSKTMVFPPASSLEESVYRTCLLQNNGYNPIHCAFTRDDTCVFSSKPDACLIREKFQIFVYRMSPLNCGVTKFQPTCTLNFSEKCDFNLTMTTETVNILFTEGDLLYFMPTCVGHSSYQNVQIQNCSRIPIKLQWKISKSDQHILSVKEQHKIIFPNEVQNHVWTFTPVVVLKHLFKVKLLASIDNLYENTLKKYSFKIVGESQNAEIICDDEYITMESIIVGSREKAQIVLNNTGGCSVNVLLSVEEFFRNSDELVSSKDLIFHLEQEELWLHSQSTKKLLVSICPKRKGWYEAKLYYMLKGTNNFELTKFLCTITVHAVFPNVLINDIRGGGSAQSYSKKCLLELFKIERFNCLLQSDPAPEELRYNALSRFSTQRRIPKTTHAVNLLDFGSNVHGSEDCIISISLENIGNYEVEWIIKYSTDFQLDIEIWADPGTIEDDELHEMFILKNKIFSIEPLCGKIYPKKSQVLKFTYRHSVIGVHKIPVLFKIIQGREIVLNLIGNTLDNSVNTLHLITSKHTFAPTSISCEIPLAQMYTLYNPTDNKLKFTFDCSNLNILQEENYNCKILECLTPIGEIFPHQSFDTLWIFSPIETKEYQVDVALNIQGGSSSIISFFGVGCDHDLSKATDDDKRRFFSNQVITLPDELVRISTDILDFGNIPLFCESSRLVFLTSISESDDVFFNWKVNQNIISVFPSHGLIKPRSQVLCKVTINAQGIPCMYSVNVMCEITNKTHMEKFVKDYSLWSARLEERKHLFTICDSSKKTLHPRHYIKTPKTPPINEDFEPSPPKLLFVHLFVYVNTHFRNTFHDDTEDIYFINRKSLTKSLSDKCIKISEEEYSIINTVLALLTRDCLHDKDFESHVVHIKEEAVPYFGMFAQVPDTNEAYDVNRENTISQSNSKSNQELKQSLQYVPDKILDEEIKQIHYNESNENVENKFSGDTSLESREQLKRCDELRCIIKKILDNTLYNILSEAAYGEISLTDRPQLIAVPPPNKKDPCK
ncbi:cilia- and flagella-associated protein 65 isoform X4 [Hydra vulgaris]|uniref:Cilia- and flagella-associated protein 65 isoform X4 n=1 Tax=Hydra vulgaris TaxID=6087 RepID=A0ABM4C2B2_HYDVU